MSNTALTAVPIPVSKRRSAGGLLRGLAGFYPTAEEAVIQQQESKRQNEVIEKGVVGGEDHANFPRGHNQEADHAPAARKKQHPYDDQFQRQGGERRCPMEPVRQVLDVPTDPGGQGTVLVVLVHGGQMAPFRIAAQQLHQA